MWRQCIIMCTEHSTHFNLCNVTRRHVSVWTYLLVSIVYVLPKK